MWLTGLYCWMSWVGWRMAWHSLVLLRGLRIWTLWVLLLMGLYLLSLMLSVLLLLLLLKLLRVKLLLVLLLIHWGRHHEAGLRCVALSSRRAVYLRCLDRRWRRGMRDNPGITTLERVAGCVVDRRLGLVRPPPVIVKVLRTGSSVLGQLLIELR